MKTPQRFEIGHPRKAASGHARPPATAGREVRSAFSEWTFANASRRDGLAPIPAVGRMERSHHRRPGLFGAGEKRAAEVLFVLIHMRSIERLVRPVIAAHRPLITVIE